MAGPRNSWQGVQDEVMERIRTRSWKPGETIPNEADLAIEFGCARTTINRALRNLAEAGVLDRRRRAGTRVAVHPVRKATLRIPIIRHEVEARGMRHGYVLLEQSEPAAPETVCAEMNCDIGTRLIKLRALHLADGMPYVIEDRWINPDVVAEARDADFSETNANEWLVANASFTKGEFAVSARSASIEDAKTLETQAGAALINVRRTTWDGPRGITLVNLIYAPGYQIQTEI